MPAGSHAERIAADRNPGHRPTADNHPSAPLPQIPVETGGPAPTPGGEKTKARNILAAIRTLKTIEAERRAASDDEKALLSRFSGFGPVALSLFLNSVTGRYKDAGWQTLGRELESLLTPEEYASAKRTTFNAFYTSPLVMRAMHAALARLGVPPSATVLEPGCGIGNFIGSAPAGMRFIGVELDSISARIARLLHPEADIRHENFRDTRLPAGLIDAVIGNVPFADTKLDYGGQRLALHDFFFAKSVDALKPGGVLALVTSRFTLDRNSAALRQWLGERADFVGAIRLPSSAFHEQGTNVVADIIFLRKRPAGEPPRHADEAWLTTEPISVDGEQVFINAYFKRHPDMVLGTFSTKNRLYAEGYSLEPSGDLAEQLRAAIEKLPLVRQPEAALSQPEPEAQLPASAAPSLLPPAGALPPERPAENHITEGSFLVGERRALYQVVDGQPQPIEYGGKRLMADGTLVGRRLAALVGLRDRARRVLQSQNEGWPEAERQQARRALNHAYDLFVAQHGPINKTTFGETRDGTIIRRIPNLVKFREDPDAMLVMSLEDYDVEGGRKWRRGAAEFGGAR